MECALDLFSAGRADVYKGAIKAAPKSTHQKARASHTEGCEVVHRVDVCNSADKAAPKSTQTQVTEGRLRLLESKYNKKINIQEGAGLVRIVGARQLHCKNGGRHVTLRAMMPLRYAKDEMTRIYASSCHQRAHGQRRLLALSYTRAHCKYKEICTLAGRACTRKGRGHTLQSSVSAAHCFNHLDFGPGAH
jgi:hypothetical protein